MRILYAVTGAGYGGAPVHVLRLMRADIANGDIVGLVTAPQSGIVGGAEELGARVFPNRFFVRRVDAVNDLRALLVVLKAVREFRPDIISAHSTKAGYAARFAGVVLRKPVVFTAHGWGFAEGRGRWRGRVLAVLERLAAAATARIICVSDWDRNVALRHGVARPEKLVVIRNGIDPEPFANADAGSVRAELSLGEKRVAVMVGRLAPQKDPMTLLLAWRSLKGDSVLLVAGDGALGEQMRDFISSEGLGDSVMLLGERRDVPQVLAAADVYVSSSRWEGLPYSIIEAMFAGLPVVATSVGGVPELVEDGVTGVLVPPGDHGLLAGALQSVLDDREMSRRMGRAGREKALREFRSDAMLDRTRQVYREALESWR